MVMKIFRRLLATSAALALIVLPLIAFATGIPLPMEKKVQAGVSTVTYAGQDFRFSTPVTLVVKFEPITETTFRMRFWQYGAAEIPANAAVAAVDVDWTTWGSDVYDGSPPSVSNPYDNVFFSESGFTEK
jgi:hypothetical protein